MKSKTLAYQEFFTEAQKKGLTANEIGQIVGNGVHGIVKCKLKQDEADGVFLALTEMVKK